MDRSRPSPPGCRSGKSQWAPVASRSKRSRGTDGRSAGSRSTPHPGMLERSSSLLLASGGLSAVYTAGRPESSVWVVFMAASSGCGGDDEGLDDAVELAREEVVALGD